MESLNYNANEKVVKLNISYAIRDKALIFSANATTFLDVEKIWLKLRVGASDVGVLRPTNIFIDSTINICRIYGSSLAFLLKETFEKLKKLSNMIQKCPYKKVTLITIHFQTI